MLESVLPSSLLIAAAGAVQIFGYLLINQTYLRLALLCSTPLYILYYFHAAADPLWGAITVSSMTLATNLLGLGALYARNAAWSLPDEHRDIYPMFDALLPGDFRKVMRMAQREVLQHAQVITTQGAVPAHLFFVARGTFFVRKNDVTFDVPGPTFVGEVAYLLNTPSAATTTLPAGTEVLIWSRPALEQAFRRNPRLKLALESLISRDLAYKVSLAVSPDARHA